MPQPPLEPALRTDLELTWHGAKRLGGAAVYVWEAVVSELLQSLALAPDETRAGLLTGHYHEGRLNGWLAWDGFAELSPVASVAEFANELRADWDLVRNRLTRGAGDPELIGWVLSRPGSGAILRPVDAMVHRSFFNLPWQITAIIDPAEERFGVYGADAEGELVNLGFCVIQRRARRSASPPV